MIGGGEEVELNKASIHSSIDIDDMLPLGKLFFAKITPLNEKSDMRLTTHTGMTAVVVMY